MIKINYSTDTIILLFIIIIVLYILTNNNLFKCKTKHNETFSSLNNKVLIETSSNKCNKRYKDTRSLTNISQYNDNDFIGEYKHFLSYRQQYTLSIPYQFIMIAINHSQNTTGNNRIFKNYNKWMHDNNSNFSYYNLFDDSLKKILNNISIK